MEASDTAATATGKSWWSPPLDSYADLMAAFLGERISATRFERQYLDLFKSDGTFWPERTYRVLNDLFLDVDAFCPDPAIRGEHDIDEPQLRARVASALTALSQEVAGTPRTA